MVEKNLCVLAIKSKTILKIKSNSNNKYTDFQEENCRSSESIKGWVKLMERHVMFFYGTQCCRSVGFSKLI